MDNIIRIVVWGAFICIFAFIYWQKFQGKKKYKDVEFQTDPDWFEHSISAYPEDPEPRDYFFHYDKEYAHQGHILEDENHQTVYEIKVLYNNGMGADETDFVNHILNVTHHHKVGKVVSAGAESGNTGVTVTSGFSFDGKNIFAWLEEKGYDYRFHVKGLAYTIDILKGGEKVGTLYSSNNGKNLYERSGNEIEAKAGGKGLLVLECTYSKLDVMVLYALAFTKAEFSAETMAKTSFSRR